MHLRIHIFVIESYLRKKHFFSRFISDCLLGMVHRYAVILVISSVIAFLSIAAIVTLIVLWLTYLSPFQDYAVVIDAGSTHSKIFVYT